MKERSLYHIRDLKNLYQNNMAFFGMDHSTKNSLNPYRDRHDFGENLRAPFQIPVIVMGTLLKNAISCIKSTMLFGINMITFNFSNAKNHSIDVVNNISQMLYSGIIGLFHSLYCALEIVTRSVATVVEAVNQRVSPCFG